jgi:DNA-binding GntR family transcriptional regulator
MTPTRGEQFEDGRDRRAPISRSAQGRDFYVRQLRGRFALAYATQTVREHKALVEAIAARRAPAIFETF